MIEHRLTREQREQAKRLIDRHTRERLKLVTAEDFLRDALFEGPRPIGELVREARERGINSQALRKAARFVGVQGGRDEPYWWLPESGAG